MDIKIKKKQIRSSNLNFVQKLKARSYNIHYKIFYCTFETLLINFVHYVTCFSIVGPDFNFSRSISLDDDLDIKLGSEKLILQFINTCTECLKNSILKKNNIVVKVLFFFHNFSNLYSTFIIQALTNHKEFLFQIESRNNIIYKFKVFTSYTKRSNVLTFRDASGLLHLSLEEIGHIFCEKYKILSFDSLNIPLSMYNKYNKSALRFKEELHIHCLNNCLLFQEGFTAFISLVVQMFGINPVSVHTIASLSFSIFRKSFYDSHHMPIEILRGNTYDFIRLSYKGGTAEVYKPLLVGGFHYDINSLYPYVMAEFKYPIGKGESVHAELINFDTFFGFLEVEVDCPIGLTVPPILLHGDALAGLFAPTGRWQGVYFSEELKFAKTLGYTFKIIKGIRYEQGDLFSKFVDALYPLRMNHAKNSAHNIILKLLMNSLYGRFGMKPGVPVTKIVSHDAYVNINVIFNVLSVTRINNQYLVSYVKKREVDKEKFFTANSKNESLSTLEKESPYRVTPTQIASAIAAYGRIAIHKYKVDPNNEVYYSDTDSLFCKNALHFKFTSKTNLGFMKLVGQVTEAYFIAPRLYACSYADKYGAKIVAKGIPKGLLKFEDFVSFYHFGIPKNIVETVFFKNYYKIFTGGEKNRLITFTPPSSQNRVKVYSKGLWIATQPKNINTLAGNFFFAIFSFFFSLIFFASLLFFFFIPIDYYYQIVLVKFVS